jgi:type I restriction enzyme, S subunit
MPRGNIKSGILQIYKILLPPLPIQRLIASILSAYDDLIENNLKRIKLLEEKAQLTYEEWFVRMKFPGHETAVFDEESGLPEGWEIILIGEFTDIKKGKNITKSTIREGSVPVVAGGLSPAYYHDTANTINPVITVSASGANAGYINLYLQDIWASDCSYIDSSMSLEFYFIYASMKSKQHFITQMQQGAAQPHVYPKDLKKLEIILPEKELRKQYENMARPMYDQIRNLKHTNTLLKEARDILLPRLMSGMVDVEELEMNESLRMVAEAQEEYNKK